MLTDVSKIGKFYNITNTSGTVLGQIQVMTHTDILDASVGQFDPDVDTYEAYLQKSIACFTGFKEIHPGTVAWYTSYEEDVTLQTLLSYAVEHGYRHIILEYIDDPDE